MSLNKDTLGVALKNARDAFSNKDMNALIAEHGSIDNVRLAACKAEAEAIINHFKNNILINIPGTGLIAPPSGGPVTGISITGTIQ